MSKAFTREDGNGDEPDDFEAEDIIPQGIKNLMTPEGYAALSKELDWLIRDERPRITEIVSWAAGNGDRSENGDYLYNKKRLREIDRRIRYLTKRTESAEIVDPRRQQGLEKVYFGATVTYIDAIEKEITVKLVSVDEADMAQGKINWLSPVAKALMKSAVGDSVTVRTEAGSTSIEIIDIAYIISE